MIAKIALLISIVATAVLQGADKPATADANKSAKAAARAAANKTAKELQTITHRITGLCYPERVDDFRTAISTEPELKLVSVDYEHAQATFEYVPKNFSAIRFRELLGKYGFAINPDPLPPAGKLAWIEIPVIGLDCKGCSLGAYLAIEKLDGVEQATASFKEGKVRALIDSTKTSRAKVEAALKKAKVELKPPEKSGD